MGLWEIVKSFILAKLAVIFFAGIVACGAVIGYQKWTISSQMEELMVLREKVQTYSEAIKNIQQAFKNDDAQVELLKEYINVLHKSSLESLSGNFDDSALRELSDILRNSKAKDGNRPTK